MLAFALVLLATGCRAPCSGVVPRVIGDDSTTEATLEALDEQLNTFTGWLDHRCVAEVYVTDNADEAGERWRTDQGWVLSLHPRTAHERLQPLVCDSYAHEVRPHLHNPLFESFDDFVAACAAGPSQALFPEQAVACGAEPFSERERFLDEEVFAGHTVRRAPTLGLRLQEQWVHAYRGGTGFSSRRTTVDGREVRGDRFGVSLLDAEEERLELEGEQVWVRAWTADPTHAYAVTRYFADDPALFTIDRASGGVTQRPITLPGGAYLDYDAAIAVLDETVYVASPSSWWDGPGLLWRIPIEAGPVTTIDLPAPIDGPNSAFEAMWPDPRTPGQLLAIHHSQLVATDYDYSFRRVFDTRLVRFDPQTGQTTPIPLPHDLNPANVLDVFDDGRLLVSIRTEHGRLAGVLDPDTGDLAVSDQICDGSALLALGDRLVHVASDRPDERWDVYGP